MDYDYGCGYIAFADTRGKARALVMGQPGLEGSDWCAVEVRRLPVLDDRRDEECVLDWTVDVRLYWEAGWFAVDTDSSCESCGRYHYDEIPESRVGQDGICYDCRGEEPGV
jgi:hypothetical protein